MAATLKVIEAAPASYPVVVGLSEKAFALNPAMIWGRIEGYVSHRWAARDVTWVVEGPGEWVPPLSPANITRVDLWTAGAWVEAFPAASPMGGYELACEGPYRVEATVGGGSVPAAAQEAYRRLAEYFAGADAMPPGVTSLDTSFGEIKRSSERAVTWLARAMINSGAADLLRPYRRAG